MVKREGKGASGALPFIFPPSFFIVSLYKPHLYMVLSLRHCYFVHVSGLLAIFRGRR